MQVILLEKVVNLGDLGEIVKVKDGYARNFLIPSGRARRATEANKAEFEAKRVELEKAAAAKLAEAQAQGEKLGGTDRQAHAEGRRRRPPVRLGHQPRHRRRAEQAGLQGREVAGAHAQRPDQDRRRQHGQRCAAHRRGGRHHRHGVRRKRLTPSASETRPQLRPCPCEAAFGRLLSFWPAAVVPRAAPASHRLSTALIHSDAGRLARP